ncbi:group II truncated hemoglobin [Pseudomaricurvus alkylphenolicus]|uniref:group II truncated hemoglobin n=1 Tax=Pseudomaricurvus alkylphenolicus TaxID=1306991 RepID=UPI0030B8736D
MSESRAYGDGDASYQAAGQYEGLQRLSERFYHYMDTLPEATTIRAMHKDDLTESKDKLARFLSGWLGGPRLYREKYGPIAIPKAHSHLPIGVAERDAWLLCMEKALAEQPYAEDFKRYMIEQLFVPAERSRTQD